MAIQVQIVHCIKYKQKKKVTVKTRTTNMNYKYKARNVQSTSKNVAHAKMNDSNKEGLMGSVVFHHSVLP